jgi:alkanesulfonate monooxygenase SsuD/methylene tetrahydromethanopterin reductase-like flavin-dependent oxidoreductase (luciferase family)
MRFGLLMPFWNPPRWRRPDTELYQDLLGQIVRAEELGYDSVWFPEHHFDVDGFTPSPLVLAASVATCTNRIRIGTDILVLPFHNPVRVAEDAATIDILSRGRLDLGVAAGYRVDEFDGFGIPRQDRWGLIQEGLEVLGLAFSEERFSFKGKFHEFNDVRLSPRPVQHPHPPIWVGARGKKAAERAARLGHNFIGSAGSAAHRSYLSTLASCGRDVSEVRIAQTFILYLAERQDEAWADVEDHLRYIMATDFRLLKAAGDLPADRALPDFENLDLRSLDPKDSPSMPIIGTPSDCVAAIERLREASPSLTTMIILTHLSGLPLAKAGRSMELFAKEVMPAFQQPRAAIKG